MNRAPFRTIIIGALFVTSLGAAVVSADDPVGSYFTYQGQLAQGGNPVNGLADLRFRLWNSGDGGTLVSPTLEVEGLAINNGLFTTGLDFGPDVFNGSQRWLEIEVRTPAGTGSFQTLAPRQLLSAVPYAFTVAVPLALNGDLGGGSLTQSAVLSVVNRSGSLTSTGIYGANVSPAGSGAGGYFECLSPSGRAVFAANGADSGAAIAGDFRTFSPDGRALYGYSGSFEGAAVGGLFSSFSPNGAGVRGVSAFSSGMSWGVHGICESPLGAGVRGEGTAGVMGVGETGVVGESVSSSGSGVHGSNLAEHGFNAGVSGGSLSDNGSGVFGHASAAEGFTYGVYGLASASPYGTGVRGEGATGVYGTGPTAVFGDASGASGIGGLFRADGEAGTGIVGIATATTGVVHGVRGESGSPTGFGVYSVGNFAATGTKSFQIDHPLDPANKLLNHYCVEGPEPLNVYSGTATFDGAAEVWVSLPKYFGAINRDVRYQLTAVGAPMPNLHVSEEVANGRFKIAGGVPGYRVSWQLSGIRADAWVRAYGAPVEVEKTAEQRGRFLAPQLSGEPNAQPLLQSARRQPSEH